VENVTGGAGNDTIIGSAAANILSGGPGDDVLNGGGGDDALHGGPGADTLRGEAGGDRLDGGSERDVAYGGEGADLLNGGAGDDTLDGGNGIDTATYASAAAAVTVSLAIAAAQATGGAGSDTLASIENLVGSSFDDRLAGNDGSNVIRGGGGKDLILGGGGNDFIFGGDGVDVVTLGAGDDVFIAEIGASLSTLKTGRMPVDIITDFDAMGDDLIDVSGLGTAFNFRGTDANKNAGDLTYKVYDSANGAENALGFDIDGNPGASNVAGPVTVVYGNTNGGAVDFAIVLLNTSSVTASDFIFSEAIAASTYSAAQASYAYQSFEDSQMRVMGDLYFA
jgi:Ca2+-binding RTX toxin-like protein